MKNQIIAKIAGEKVKLENKSFCYFQIGDIVTRDKDVLRDRVWHDKEVKVVGFTYYPDRLWGVIKQESSYEQTPLWTNNLDGLLLMGGKEWKFKVGDEVVDRGLRKGRVIMIIPRIYHEMTERRYLVEFNSEEKGEAIMGNSLFIPLRYRDRCIKNCLFYNEEDIAYNEGDIAKY